MERHSKRGIGLLAVTLGLYAGILLADGLSEDRLFSAQENRLLAQRPTVSKEGLKDGSFAKALEAWVTDQFPGRDGWIAAKTAFLRLTGKKDVNGVYFAPGNTLMECHRAGSVDEAAAGRKLEGLAAQAQEIGGLIDGKVTVLLVPSAAAVQPYRLPAFAPEFDQAGWLETAGKKLEAAGISFLNGERILSEYAGERIYYGTDHHWTTLGAFFAWQAFERSMGREPLPLGEYERTVVKDDFLGTLQARVNLPVTPDSIERFGRKQEGEHAVFFPASGEGADSCYFYERLETKDAYAFFLNGNVPLARLSGDGPKEKTILLVRDSYADCFAPFLTASYGTIWLMDPRYYRGDPAELVKRLDPGDVLYLYQIFHFLGP